MPKPNPKQLGSQPDLSHLHKKEDTYDPDYVNYKMCTECQKFSLRIDQANGQVVCNLCGIVELGNLIDMTKENRNFGAEGNSGVLMERTGNPMRPE